MIIMETLPGQRPYLLGFAFSMPSEASTCSISVHPMMKTVAQSSSYVLFLTLKKKSDDLTAFVARKGSVRKA